jgi:hypothetical protein
MVEFGTGRWGSYRKLDWGTSTSMWYEIALELSSLCSLVGNRFFWLFYSFAASWATYADFESNSTFGDSGSPCQRLLLPPIHAILKNHQLLSGTTWNYIG